MRTRTTFVFFCFAWMTLLSIGLLDVHAEPCASYLSGYLTKLSAYNAADTFLRRQVVVAAATGQLDPSALNEPPVITTYFLPVKGLGFPRLGGGTETGSPLSPRYRSEVTPLRKRLAQREQGFQQHRGSIRQISSKSTPHRRQSRRFPHQVPLSDRYHLPW